MGLGYRFIQGGQGSLTDCGHLKILSEEREWPCQCQCLLEEWRVGFMFHFTQIYF